MIVVLPESDRHCEELVGNDWWEMVGLCGPEASFLPKSARYGQALDYVRITRVELKFITEAFVGVL